MSINACETGPILLPGAGETLADAAFAIVICPADVPQMPRPRRLLLRMSLAALEREEFSSAFDTLRPDGVLLTACSGRADLEAADVALGVIEAETDRAAGSLSIIAVLGVSPASFLGNRRLAGGSERLIALVLDENMLGEAMGRPAEAALSMSPAVFAARGHVLLQAADCGVPCFVSLPSGESDASALVRLRDAALAQGFSNVSIETPAQWLALS